MTEKDKKTKKTKVAKTTTAKTAKAAKATKAAANPVARERQGKKEKSVADAKVVLRIRVRAYESKILDASVKQIMDTAMRYDANIV
jgi:hypothetical protein